MSSSVHPGGPFSALPQGSAPGDQRPPRQPRSAATATSGAHRASGPSLAAVPSATQPPEITSPEEEEVFPTGPAMELPVLHDQCARADCADAANAVADLCEGARDASVLFDVLEGFGDSLSALRELIADLHEQQVLDKAMEAASDSPPVRRRRRRDPSGEAIKLQQRVSAAVAPVSGYLRVFAAVLDDVLGTTLPAGDATPHAGDSASGWHARMSQAFGADQAPDVYTLGIVYDVIAELCKLVPTHTDAADDVQQWLAASRQAVDEAEALEEARRKALTHHMAPDPRKAAVPPLNIGAAVLLSAGPAVPKGRARRRSSTPTLMHRHSMEFAGPAHDDNAADSTSRLAQSFSLSPRANAEPAAARLASVGHGNAAAAAVKRRRAAQRLLACAHKVGQLFVSADIEALLGIKNEYEALKATAGVSRGGGVGSVTSLPGASPVSGAIPAQCNAAPLALPSKARLASSSSFRTSSINSNSVHGRLSVSGAALDRRDTTSDSESSRKPSDAAQFPASFAMFRSMSVPTLGGGPQSRPLLVYCVDEWLRQVPFLLGQEDAAQCAAIPDPAASMRSGGGNGTLHRHPVDDAIEFRAAAGLLSLRCSAGEREDDVALVPPAPGRSRTASPPPFRGPGTKYAVDNALLSPDSADAPPKHGAAWGADPNGAAELRVWQLKHRAFFAIDTTLSAVTALVCSVVTGLCSLECPPPVSAPEIEEFCTAASLDLSLPDPAVGTSAAAVRGLVGCNELAVAQPQAPPVGAEALHTACAPLNRIHAVASNAARVLWPEDHSAVPSRRASCAASSARGRPPLSRCTSDDTTRHRVDPREHRSESKNGPPPPSDLASLTQSAMHLRRSLRVAAYATAPLVGATTPLILDACRLLVPLVYDCALGLMSDFSSTLGVSGGVPGLGGAAGGSAKDGFHYLSSPLNTPWDAAHSAEEPPPLDVGDAVLPFATHSPEVGAGNPRSRTAAVTQAIAAAGGSDALLHDLLALLIQWLRTPQFSPVVSAALCGLLAPRSPVVALVRATLASTCVGSVGAPLGSPAGRGRRAFDDGEQDTLLSDDEYIDGEDDDFDADSEDSVARPYDPTDPVSRTLSPTGSQRGFVAHNAPPTPTAGTPFGQSRRNSAGHVVPPAGRRPRRGGRKAHGDFDCDDDSDCDGCPVTEAGVSYFACPPPPVTRAQRRRRLLHVARLVRGFRPAEHGPEFADAFPSMLCVLPAAEFQNPEHAALLDPSGGLCLRALADPHTSPSVALDSLRWLACELRHGPGGSGLGDASVRFMLAANQNSLEQRRATFHADLPSAPSPPPEPKESKPATTSNGLLAVSSGQSGTASLGSSALHRRASMVSVVEPLDPRRQSMPPHVGSPTRRSCGSYAGSLSGVGSTEPHRPSMVYLQPQWPSSFVRFIYVAFLTCYHAPAVREAVGATSPKATRSPQARERPSGSAQTLPIVSDLEARQRAKVNAKAHHAQQQRRAAAATELAVKQRRLRQPRAAASLRALRALLRHSTAARAQVSTLGVVETLVRELDLEHYVQERRMRQLHRTNSAVDKFIERAGHPALGRTSPTTQTSQGESRTDTNTPVPDGRVSPGVVSPPAALEPKKAGTAKSDASFDARGPSASELASARTAGQTSIVSGRATEGSEGPGSVTSETASPGVTPSLTSPLSRGQTPRTAPVPAPPRKLPPKMAIPKLSLGAAPPPLYFMSKGDTGDAANTAVLSGMGTGAQLGGSFATTPSTPTAMKQPFSVPNVPTFSVPAPLASTSTAPGGKGDDRGLAGSGRQQPLNVSFVGTVDPDPLRSPVSMPNASGSVVPPVLMDAGGSPKRTSLDDDREGRKVLRITLPAGTEERRDSDSEQPFFSATLGRENSLLMSPNGGPSSRPTPVGMLRQMSPRSGSVIMLDTQRSLKTNEPSAPLSPTASAGTESLAVVDVVDHGLYPAHLLSRGEDFLHLQRQTRRVYADSLVHMELILTVAQGVMTEHGVIAPKFSAHQAHARGASAVRLLESHLRHPANSAVAHSARLFAERRWQRCAGPHCMTHSVGSGVQAVPLLLALLAPDETFGQRYVLGEQIGAGAYGTVFEAGIRKGDSDAELPTTWPLAVKRVPLGGDRPAAVALHTELVAFNRLRGTGLAPDVIEVASSGMHIHIVTRRLGGDLSRWAKKWRSVRTIGAQEAMEMYRAKGRARQRAQLREQQMQRHPASPFGRAMSATFAKDDDGSPILPQRGPGTPLQGTLDHSGLSRRPGMGDSGIFDNNSPSRTPGGDVFGPGEISNLGVTAVQRWVALLRRFRGVAVAVSRLHDLGIVHGDLKADNVLLAPHGSDSPVCITDFGDCEFAWENVAPTNEANPMSGFGSTATFHTGFGAQASSTSSGFRAFHSETDTITPFDTASEGSESLGSSARSHRSFNFGAPPAPRNGFDVDMDAAIAAPLGTEVVRAPELLHPHVYLPDRKRRTDPAWRALRDVWALGCLLYELVTGAFLFFDEDVTATYYRIAHADGVLLEAKHYAAIADNLAGSDPDTPSPSGADRSGSGSPEGLIHHVKSPAAAEPALEHAEARVAVSPEATACVKLLLYVLVRQPAQRPDIQQLLAEVDTMLWQAEKRLHRQQQCGDPATPQRSVMSPKTIGSAKDAVKPIALHTFDDDDDDDNDDPRFQLIVRAPQPRQTSSPPLSPMSAALSRTDTGDDEFRGVNFDELWIPATPIGSDVEVEDEEPTPFLDDHFSSKAVASQRQGGTPPLSSDDDARRHHLEAAGAASPIMVGHALRRHSSAAGLTPPFDAKGSRRASAATLQPLDSTVSADMSRLTEKSSFRSPAQPLDFVVPNTRHASLAEGGMSASSRPLLEVSREAIRRQSLRSANASVTDTSLRNIDQMCSSLSKYSDRTQSTLPPALRDAGGTSPTQSRTLPPRVPPSVALDGSAGLGDSGTYQAQAAALLTKKDPSPAGPTAHHEEDSIMRIDVDARTPPVSKPRRRSRRSFRSAVDDDDDEGDLQDTDMDGSDLDESSTFGDTESEDLAFLRTRHEEQSAAAATLTKSRSTTPRQLALMQAALRSGKGTFSISGIPQRQEASGPFSSTTRSVQEVADLEGAAHGLDLDVEPVLSWDAALSAAASAAAERRPSIAAVSVEHQASKTRPPAPLCQFPGQVDTHGSSATTTTSSGTGHRLSKTTSGGLPAATSGAFTHHNSFAAGGPAVSTDAPRPVQLVPGIYLAASSATPPSMWSRCNVSRVVSFQRPLLDTAGRSAPVTLGGVTPASRAVLGLFAARPSPTFTLGGQVFWSRHVFNPESTATGSRKSSQISASAASRNPLSTHRSTPHAANAPDALSQQGGLLQQQQARQRQVFRDTGNANAFYPPYIPPISRRFGCARVIPLFDALAALYPDLRRAQGKGRWAQAESDGARPSLTDHQRAEAQIVFARAVRHAVAEVQDTVANGGSAAFDALRVASCDLGVCVALCYFAATYGVIPLVAAGALMWRIPGRLGGRTDADEWDGARDGGRRGDSAVSPTHRGSDSFNPFAARTPTAASAHHAQNDDADVSNDTGSDEGATQFAGTIGAADRIVALWALDDAAVTDERERTKATSGGPGWGVDPGLTVPVHAPGHSMTSAPPGVASVEGHTTGTGTPEPPSPVRPSQAMLTGRKSRCMCGYCVLVTVSNAAVMAFNVAEEEQPLPGSPRSTLSPHDLPRRAAPVSPQPQLESVAPASLLQAHHTMVRRLYGPYVAGRLYPNGQAELAVTSSPAGWVVGPAREFVVEGHWTVTVCARCTTPLMAITTAPPPGQTVTGVRGVGFVGLPLTGRKFGGRPKNSVASGGGIGGDDLRPAAFFQHAL